MRKIFLFAGALALSGSTQAAVVLKGSGDASFRVKTVRARTVIEGGLATTSLVWTFADTQRRWKPEVEFFYGAPPRGVVTFFAYWFRGERVVARVVERERASSIYNQLTQWGVDPALIELDGKNTFRARIFPVEANQDVRVEMHLVQPLETTALGQKWVLPLAQKFVSPRRLSKWLPASPGVRPTYDNVEIEVETRDAGAVNLPGAKFRNGKWRFEARNFVANRDFVLGWTKPKVPLRADVYSSRASARDGYFSLLLSPAQAMKNPRLKVSGARVFDVFPRTLPNLCAGENVLVSGRYREAARATISLVDEAKSLSTRVEFSNQRGANNPAAKLWAARQIADLGANESARTRVIALSKRWNLPSAQTSWLAVPRSEKANFEATRKQAEVAKLARQIASDLVLKRGGKTELAQKRAQLAGLLRDRYNKTVVDEAVESQISRAVEVLASHLARAHEAERMETRPDARKLASLRAQLDASIGVLNNRESQGQNRSLGGTTQQFLQNQRAFLAEEEAQKIAPQYVEAVLEEGENSLRARQLLQQFKRNKKMSNAGGYDPLNAVFYSRLRVPLHQLAYEKQREEARLNPNRTKIAEINADMKRLAALMKNNWGKAEAFVDWQEFPAARDSIHELLGDYAREIQTGNSDSQKLKALHRKIDGLLAPQRRYFRNDLEYFRVQDETKGYFFNPLDDPEIQAAQKRGDKRELLAQIDRKRQFFARPGDPLIEINAPFDSRNVVAILPDGAIKKLDFNIRSRRWETRFDVPTYAPDGLYTVQIIVVDDLGARRVLKLHFRVDTQAPNALAQLQFANGQAQLQLETDAQTDRVSAFLPDNRRVELRRSPLRPTLFAATVDAPAAGSRVRFIVTDRAHNRTEVFVDWK